MNIARKMDEEWTPTFQGRKSTDDKKDNMEDMEPTLKGQKPNERSWGFLIFYAVLDLTGMT